MKDASSLGSRADIPKDAQTQFGTRGRQNTAPVPKTLSMPIFGAVGGLFGDVLLVPRIRFPRACFISRWGHSSLSNSKSTRNEFSRHSTATHPAHYAAFAISTTGGNAVCNFAIVSSSITFVVSRLCCVWNCANADKVWWPAIPSTSPG
jgi:hypothetical protein